MLSSTSKAVTSIVLMSGFMFFTFFISPIPSKPGILKSEIISTYDFLLTLKCSKAIKGFVKAKTENPEAINASRYS